MLARIAGVIVSGAIALGALLVPVATASAAVSVAPASNYAQVVRNCQHGPWHCENVSQAVRGALRIGNRPAVLRIGETSTVYVWNANGTVTAYSS